MDIHVNDLVFEDGFKDVFLKDISFRDIDQEFIFVRTVESFDTDAVNILYYCFIKPYQGQVFRRIGETDERNNKVYVDEDMKDIEDLPYSAIKNATISKIIENGDLISNQLIVDIPFDYYDGNDELKDLMQTRKVMWIDDRRVKGNPDYIEVDIEGSIQKVKLISCTEEGVVIQLDNNETYIYEKNGTVKRI